MGLHLKTAAAIFTRSPAAFVRAHLHALHGGQCSLLIPDQDHDLLNEAAQHCDQVTVYTDRPGDPALADYKTISVADLPMHRSIPAEMAPGTAVAVLFTSGSTGRAQFVPKNFQNFAGEARSLDRLFRATGEQVRVLTTLPFEHMYGYMYGFFWPRLLGLDAPAGRITLPAALAKELQQSDLPVWLITTPLHLNAFAETGLRTEKVTRVFSATSALSPSLAAEARQCFGVAVTDIYGSTETGTIASRQMAGESDLWECIPGRSLTQCADGRIQLDCVDLSRPELLNDVLELSSPRQFRVLGRSADLVKVAGKRTSLGALNAALLTAPGVRDGSFWVPDHYDDTDVVRLVAFAVLREGATKDAVIAHLRTHVYPLFLPRPLFIVDNLPRDTVGKLPRASLRELHTTCRSRGSIATVSVD
jgi:acyl-coenzyme A synthetase/AMP-(fatty) acid ligase